MTSCLTGLQIKTLSITVPLTSCLTGLQIKTKIASCHTADFKPVKQEVIGTVILPPLEFHAAALKFFIVQAPG